MVAGVELPIKTVQEGTSAMKMAKTIFGDGVQVTGATYTGDPLSAGVYTKGDKKSPDVTPSNKGVILSTGHAEDFANDGPESNVATDTTTDTLGTDNDPENNASANANTYDAATLDVDFIPDGGLMTMQFVFSSEEYPEFQNSIYQDFFGVWINGEPITTSVGGGNVNPAAINSGNNINFFIDNQNDDYNTEMDGFTITMTLTMVVIPDQVNSLRLTLADVADPFYDSNLLIAGNSVQTSLIAMDDNIYAPANASNTVDLLSNDISGSTLTITHLNGQEVVAGDSVTLNTGQTLQLNADGTITVTGDTDPEDFQFTYGITDGVNTDTGLVNASSVPCFVAGTLIQTESGERRVEDLRPGDLVQTKDDGLQPLRWAGARTVAAEGEFAPIRISAGAFGNHNDLFVSPLHRVLVRDVLTELLFGEPEVLVAARDLVDGHTVCHCPGGAVTYIHLLFDRHQILFSAGLETESYLPGPQTAKSFEPEVLDEICKIFPELDPHSGDGYPSAARRTLRKFEADLLRQKRAA